MRVRASILGGSPAEVEHAKRPLQRQDNTSLARPEDDASRVNGRSPADSGYQVFDGGESLTRGFLACYNEVADTRLDGPDAGRSSPGALVCGRRRPGAVWTD